MIARWTDHLESTRAPRTAHEYIAAVRYFEQFHVENSLPNMTTETLQRYVDEVSRTLAPRTVHFRVSAIREYLKFCGYTPGKIKLPRVKRSPPRFLNTDQLADFMEHCERVRNPAIAAALKLLPLTGLRIRSEMLSLSPINIEKNPDGLWLRFVGKGMSTREVPLVDGAAAVLATYRARHCAPDMGEHDKLFPVSYKAVYDQLVSIASTMGLKWLHPHVLRHTFATNLRAQGVPLEEIQALLGHSKLSTTGMYAHATRETMRRAVVQGSTDQ